MRKKLQSVAGSIALCLLAWASACSTTTTAPEPQAAAVSNDAMTVENLLRWPLEGSAGADKVVSGLKQVLDLQEVRPSRLSADGPTKLKDGYILTFARVQELEGAIHIGLGTEPCFSPVRAATVTEAVQNPVFQDAHGIDRGRTYDARRNGVWLQIATTPVTYRCVESIHIRPIQ